MGIRKRLLGATSLGMTVDKDSWPRKVFDVGNIALGLAVAALGILTIGSTALTATPAQANIVDTDNRVSIIGDTGTTQKMDVTLSSFEVNTTNPGDTTVPAAGLDYIAFNTVNPTPWAITNDGTPGNEINLSMARPLTGADDGSADPVPHVDLMAEGSHPPHWNGSIQADDVLTAMATNPLWNGSIDQGGAEMGETEWTKVSFNGSGPAMNGSITGGMDDATGSSFSYGAAVLS